VFVAVLRQHGSVCSGIEAATNGWHHMGWEPAFFSEIENFPRAVLEHHYPEVPLHGDFTTIGDSDYGPIDLLVGGTPCQSFSIAGLRKGLDDDRGNLALEYIRLAARKRPRWLVWENVPGVLSSNGGRDFGAFIGGLVEFGYGFSYRVLDAQYFGVPQRRRRVFLVGYLGDWRPAAAVLFERKSLSGDSAPSREARKGATRETSAGSKSSRKWPADVAATMNARFSDKMGLEDQHAFGGASYFVPATNGTLTARMMNALGARDVEEGAVIPFSAYNQTAGGYVAETVAARSDQDTTSCIAFSECRPLNSMSIQGRPSDDNRMGSGIGKDGDPCPTITKAHHHAVSYALAGNWIGRKPENGGNQVAPFVDESPCLTKTDRHAVASETLGVRRLTPIECERLQGFPDNFTRIPYRNKPEDQCPDGPRYKALGNSMAVPVMKWIGERIAEVESILAVEEAL
jgi:DNA (cytosine-5)-methyltransferase 1